ncbi:DUF4190 domain-containing protein [Verrucomicrobiota bacterium sgz303538]
MQYLIWREGAQEGPYSTAQLSSMQSLGDLPENTLYWLEEAQQWRPVTELVSVNTAPETTLNPPPVTPPARAKRISQLALWSLGTGLLGLVTVVPSVVAVVTGHLALNAIRRAPHRLGGRSAALWGIILGYLVVFGMLLLVLGAFAFGLLQGLKDTVNEPARLQATRTDVELIITAIRSYVTEYGRYPEVPSFRVDAGDLLVGEDPYTGHRSSNADLFFVLRAVPQGANANHKLNPRRIVFLQTRDVADPANPQGGIGPDGVAYDLWGEPYRVEIDANYDNHLPLPWREQGSDTTRANVLVWSAGPDRQTNRTTTSDDISIWQ